MLKNKIYWVSCVITVGVVVFDVGANVVVFVGGNVVIFAGVHSPHVNWQSNLTFSFWQFLFAHFSAPIASSQTVYGSYSH